MNFDAFVNNLQYMLAGMLGVFMIVGIIMGATYLISHFTARLGGKNTDE
ncbi:MAG: oxaloacetate decarboxylase [Clostridia bacterium]|nr:oxaloacetate decarboxylase [Clostridia bacterium]